MHDPLFFFEQTDFSLRFARCSISDTALNIEDVKEVALNDAATLAQLAPAGTQVVCALRPKPRQLHLASVDEAKRYPGPAGLQQFAQLPLFAKGEPAWFTGVQASDGTPPAGNHWVISLSSDAAHRQARGVIEALKLKPARCLDGSLVSIGALTSTITSPTLLLEIGELNSHAVLIGPEGIIALRSVTLNLDQIAETVQQELNLKFRGSAAKLFFNPDCDFTDTGPKIAARLGAILKADLIPLLAGHPAPTTLCCAGLPALQHWLEIQLATVLGLTPHVPDVKAWSTAVGMTFGSSALASSVSPAWFTFLHFINSQTLESPAAVAWQAEWLPIAIPLAVKPSTPASLAPSAQRPVQPATPAPGAALTHLPIKSGSTPTLAKLASAPTPPAAKITPPTPAPKVTPVTGTTKPVTASVAQIKPTPASSAKPTPVPAAAPAKPAVSSVQYSSKPAPSSAPSANQKSPGKSKMPLVIGLGALLLVLLAGGFFFLQSQKEETARIALDKQKAEERVKAEEERARVAEQKAREETESRRKFELETSQKLARAETARQQAEDEARNQTATRLANARGTLVVTTQPAGATVTVGDLPPRAAPAKFDYLKIGKYPVTVTLAHHEEVKLELEVTENNTTDSGLITLNTLVGSVKLTSEPSESSYELRAANTFAITGEGKRTGQTPATVDNLEPGEYTVTFSRSGWAPHTETISVARNATSSATWTFPSGTVKITSSPTGATVSQDGVKLGLTPLTVRQAPIKTQYELKLAFHDPVTLPALIEEGKTLELTAQLPATDIVFGPADLDKKPEPINPKTPELPNILTLVEGRVVVQMTVNRDGSTADLKLIRASNAELGKIYLAALAKWKFKPGMKDGKPVRSGVVVPFLITASKD